MMLREVGCPRCDAFKWHGCIVCGTYVCGECGHRGTACGEHFRGDEHYCEVRKLRARVKRLSVAIQLLYNSHGCCSFRYNEVCHMCKGIRERVEAALDDQGK